MCVHLIAEWNHNCKIIRFYNSNRDSIEFHKNRIQISNYHAPMHVSTIMFSVIVIMSLTLLFLGPIEISFVKNVKRPLEISKAKSWWPYIKVLLCQIKFIEQKFKIMSTTKLTLLIFSLITTTQHFIPFHIKEYKPM